MKGQVKGFICWSLIFLTFLLHSLLRINFPEGKRKNESKQLDPQRRLKSPEFELKGQKNAVPPQLFQRPELSRPNPPHGSWVEASA